MGGHLDGLAVLVVQLVQRGGKGLSPRLEDIHLLAPEKPVALPQGDQAVLPALAHGHQLVAPGVVAAVQRLAGLAPKVKAVGIGPVADFLRLRQDGGGQRLAGVLPGEINGPTVGGGDAGHIVGGLGPALDFQAGDARVHHLGDGVNHPQVVGVEEVGALLLLGEGEDLPRALGLHQVVLPAAGLGALAPVGVPAGHIVGDDAPAGKGHAHGPVDKGLQLQAGVGVLPDALNFGEGHLPGQHHPLGPQLPADLGGGKVHNARLGGDVPLHLGGHFPGQGQHPQIGDDKGVHPRLLAGGEEAGQRLKFLVAGQGVAGDVDLHPPLVAEVHGLGQLLRPKVGRGRAHAEALSRQVHRVRAVAHRGL